MGRYVFLTVFFGLNVFWIHCGSSSHKPVVKQKTISDLESKDFFKNVIYDLAQERIEKSNLGNKKYYSDALKSKLMSPKDLPDTIAKPKVLVFYYPEKTVVADSQTGFEWTVLENCSKWEANKKNRSPNIELVAFVKRY